jgi:hypothetical protein
LLIRGGEGEEIINGENEIKLKGLDARVESERDSWNRNLNNQHRKLVKEKKKLIQTLKKSYKIINYM